MAEDIEHLKKHIKLYWMVGGALLFLTIVTVVVAYIPFSAVGHMIVGLSIAALKAGMVAAIFMHLNAEKKIRLHHPGLLGCLLHRPDGFVYLRLVAGTGSCSGHLVGNCTMSLKTFHIIFITLALLSCAGLIWLFLGFERDFPGSGYQAYAIFFSFLSVALLGYGVWFLKKLKKHPLDS
ncbi:MAG: cytochrome C oxidase subunit IV family protein [Blastochloris sp.]|nr:cytochrome C oxidase subunit IV family protein [Blastochloris sp.]